MTRGLDERTLQVWRAIGAAGAAGISGTALHDKFHNVIDSDVINVKLQSLKRGGYINHKGENSYGAWLITRGNNLPRGQEWPVWLFEPSDTDEEAAHAHALAAGKAEVKLPAAPASVFNPAPALDSSWSVISPAPADVATAGMTSERRSLYPEDEGFVCALYSDGVLWIEADGRQLSLEVKYTRELLHYLDKLRANDVVEDALHAAGAAA